MAYMFQFVDLSLYRISFLTTTTLAYTSCIFVKQRKLQIIITVLETLLWLSILLILKGGYAVGFGGAPDNTILLFDYLSLAVRLYLIFILLNVSKIWQFEFPKSTLALGFAFLILSIKVDFFAMPLVNLPAPPIQYIETDY